MDFSQKTQFVMLLLATGLVIWTVGYKEYSVKHLIGFFTGWLLPGMGYYLFGKKLKFIFFASVLTFMYMAGLIISNFGLVGIEDNVYYYICQFGSLPTTVLGELLKNNRPYIAEPFSLSILDPAQLYMCIPPLLNFLVAISIFNVKLENAENKI